MKQSTLIILTLGILVLAAVVFMLPGDEAPAEETSTQIVEDDDDDIIVAKPYKPRLRKQYRFATSSEYDDAALDSLVKRDWIAMVNAINSSDPDNYMIYTSFPLAGDWSYVSGQRDKGSEIDERHFRMMFTQFFEPIMDQIWVGGWKEYQKIGNDPLMVRFYFDLTGKVYKKGRFISYIVGDDTLRMNNVWEID